jgi:hypothetical protein
VIVYRHAVVTVARSGPRPVRSANSRSVGARASTSVSRTRGHVSQYPGVVLGQRRLRCLADEAAVAGDDEGGQRPYEGLEAPGGGDYCLAGAAGGVEVAAVANAGGA